MAALSQTDIRRTPLYDRHVEAGARLVPFAGWEMPVQYVGVAAEHAAVRATAGIFDVSHMGEIETAGPQALELLQRLLSNDVGQIPVGGAQYSVLCREDGGVLDDLFTYRLDADRFLTITNACNHERDVAWFRQWADAYDATVEDVADRYAMLAVQGPHAREIVQAASDRPLPARMTVGERAVAGVQTLVCGTGYTGEDGVELLLPPADAVRVWDDIVRRGATPAGLAARDTLRLEACFHLYGNDLSEDRGPIEAGLGWCCKEATGFVGADAVAAARQDGVGSERLVPFKISASGIARQGNPIIGGGIVTSGTHSPSLGIGVGLAYLPSERAVPGTSFEIDVRGKLRSAVVTTKPLYVKDSNGKDSDG